MSRLLLLLVIVFVIYLLLKSYRKQIRKEELPSEEAVSAQDMVCCAHCGVHLPKHESVHIEDKFYCSEAHRRAHDQPD